MQKISFAVYELRDFVIPTRKKRGSQREKEILLCCGIH